MKMVEIAEAGSLIIRGEMDTSDIEQGFSRVENHFELAREKSSSFNSDLSRIGSVLGSLTKTLLGFGLAASGALVGLAKDAPAVAPALAEMDVAMTKLKFTVGDALAPAFERASNLFNRFVEDVGSSSSQSFISSFGEGFLDFFEGAYNLVDKLTTKYKEFKKIVTGKSEEGTEKGAEVSLETEGRILGKATAGGLTYLTVDKLTKGGLTSILKNITNKIISWGGTAVGEVGGLLSGVTWNPFIPMVSEWAGKMPGVQYIGWNDLGYSSRQQSKGEQFGSYVISA